MTTTDPHEALDALLNDVVEQITGNPDARPRPGQLALSHDVLDAMDTRGGQACGVAPCGVGKALDLETPIATPSGWTTMGQLASGDQVFDEQGQVCDVLGVSPVFHDRACYEVEFRSGETIVCDAEHLWPTATRALRFAQAERRRGEARPASIAAYERVLKLDSVRSNIEGAPWHTLTAAGMLLAGLADRSTISLARTHLGGSALGCGERFDLRPVLDVIITNGRARSTLHQLAPEQYSVMTAQDMRDTIREGGALNHAVPVAGALDLPEAELPIDPWLLGVWLGDGSSYSGTICVGTDDYEATKALVEGAWRGRVTTWRNDHSWTLSPVQPAPDRCPFGHQEWKQANHKPNRLCRACMRVDGRSGERWNTGLAQNLRVLGLKKNKHIPTAYLRASFAQRLALLQGLMDTDGTVRDGGRAEFSVSNERLARDTYELALSLGLKAQFRSGPAVMVLGGPDAPVRVQCGTRWRIGWTSQLPVFRLPRKAQRLAASSDTLMPSIAMYRYVADIRPVPSRPVRCIVVSSESHLFLAGRDLIPTHNSLAYLAPAVLLAATRGDRVVVATESLALQSQILEKDAPMVVAAAQRLHQVAPRVAVLKGWSNFACARSTVATAQVVLGDPFSAGHVTEAGMVALANRVDQLVTDGAAVTGPFAALLGGAGATVEVDGRDVPLDEMAPLVSWALRQHAPTAHAEPGDRHSYPGKTDASTWGSISVTPAECVGANACPFSDMCKPAKAKQLAADADIVVTNHSMISTQAANALAVVIGSKKLGDFDHIIIDEAHALPAQVRTQGAKEVSGRRILGIVKAMKSVLDDRDRLVSGVLGDGSILADEIDAELARFMGRATGRETVAKLKEGENPVSDCGDLLEAWLDRCANLLNGATGHAHGDVEMKVRRVKGRIDNLKADLKAVVDHRVGVARWVDQDTRSGTRPWSAAHASPVEIGGMLIGNLWTSPIPADEDAPEPSEDISAERITGTWGEDRYELSVIAVSATLPTGFAREMGMRAQAGEYPSPFDDAFASSALYVPRAVSDADVSALSISFSGQGKARFDTKAHVNWCKPILEDLVEANGGSGLILAATAQAGREYADTLRAAARGRWEVYSQWDGNALRMTTAAWREDHHAVLVGTRSLMTGVDAPGDTCSLVVVDRIARSPGNPVDDARVEALMKRLECDKWAADRFTYASDAALLLEQAAGRLIRSMADSGMVAVLDPRLLKIGPFRYQEQTRTIYMKALGRFERKMSELADATDFLEQRRRAAGMAA